MIKVTYSMVDDHYTYLNVKGHANSGEYGKDLICASVTSIMWGLMNALDDTGLDVDIKELNNQITIVNNSKDEVIDDYFKLTIFQLKTIEESYGEFIKVERK